MRQRPDRAAGVDQDRQRLGPAAQANDQLAAERTGRRCFGMELDPLYVDVIVRRWQAYSLIRMEGISTL